MDQDRRSIRQRGRHHPPAPELSVQCSAPIEAGDRGAGLAIISASPALRSNLSDVSQTGYHSPQPRRPGLLVPALQPGDLMTIAPTITAEELDRICQWQEERIDNPRADRSNTWPAEVVRFISWRGSSTLLIPCLDGGRCVIERHFQSAHTFHRCYRHNIYVLWADPIQ